MTKLDYAKFGAKFAVQIVAARVLSNVIVNNTDVEEDSIPLRVGTVVAGCYVGNALEPQTDALVEMAANKLSSLRTQTA